MSPPPTPPTTGGVSGTLDANSNDVPNCVDHCPGMDYVDFAPECAGVIPTVAAWI